MKKYIVILSLGLLTLGVTSCEDPLEDFETETTVENSDISITLKSGDTNNSQNGSSESDNDTGGETQQLPKK